MCPPATAHHVNHMQALEMRSMVLIRIWYRWFVSIDSSEPENSEKIDQICYTFRLDAQTVFSVSNIETLKTSAEADAFVDFVPFLNIPTFVNDAVYKFE